MLKLFQIDSMQILCKTFSTTIVEIFLVSYFVTNGLHFILEIFRNAEINCAHGV